MLIPIWEAISCLLFPDASFRRASSISMGQSFGFLPAPRPMISGSNLTDMVYLTYPETPWFRLGDNEKNIPCFVRTLLIRASSFSRRRSVSLSTRAWNEKRSFVTSIINTSLCGESIWHTLWRIILEINYENTYHRRPEMCQSNYITIRYNTLYIKYRNLTKKNPLPIRDSGVLAHYSTSELRRKLFRGYASTLMPEEPFLTRFLHYFRFISVVYIIPICYNLKF